MKQKLETAFSDRMSFVFSCVCAFLALSFVRVNFYVREDAFSGAFSDLGKSGYSLPGRTGSVFGTYLLLLPALLIGFYFFYALVVRERKNASAVLSAVTVPVACILPLFFLSKAVSDEAVLTGESFVPGLFSFILLTVMIACQSKDTLPAEAYAHCALAALSVSWTLGMLRAILPFAPKPLWIPFAVCYLAGLAFLRIPSAENPVTREKKYTLLSFLVSLPTVACLLSETIRILATRERPLQQPAVFFAGGLLLYLVIAFALSFSGRKTVKNVPYTAAVLAMAMLIALPDAQLRYWYDHSGLFELGNTSIVTETVLAGKLPGVGVFSAHMLSDWLMQFVYYLFNGDLTGAVINVYGSLGNIYCLLILFSLLRRMIKPSYAYLLTAFLPLFGISSYLPGLNFLPVFALLLVLKNDSLKTCLLFWGSLLFAFLLSFDNGFSVAVACLAVLGLLVFFRKAAVHPKRFFSAMAFVTCGALLVFLAGCLKEGVSFFDRMREFLSVTAGSNSVWAYTRIGDLQSPAAFLVYGLIPATTVGILLYLVCSVKRLREEDMTGFIFTVSLCFVQLMAVSRSLVLYTLGNGVTPRLFPHYAFMVASFALFLTRGTDMRKTVVFALSFLAVLLMKDALATGISFRTPRIPLAVAESAALEKDTATDGAQEAGRVELEAKEGCDHNALKERLDMLLTEDETFVDFANVSGLYGLLERERPFYVAQSPSLLTNEYTQRMFISEIERNGKAKLAIFAMDDVGYMHSTVGIPHSTRYYLAAEYLFANYRPLCQVKDYAIWGRKDCYIEMARTLLLERIPALPWQYGEVSALHTYDYGAYAWLWANRDRKNAADSPVVCEPERSSDGSYRLPAFEKEGGYYLSFTANAGGGTVSAVFSDENGQTLCVYTAKLREGEHAYLFRCSNDYSWYTIPALSVSFEFSEDGMEENVRILKAQD